MNEAEISRAIDNIRLYRERFASPVAELREHIGAIEDPKLLPEYLGSGSNGSAFRIRANGKAYAVKFNESVAQLNYEAKSLRQASGIPRSAQLVAYSFEDLAMIMELMPGRDVTKIPPEDSMEYSDDHIVGLVETILALHGRGINVDPKASNFLYDPESGFSVLDFHLSEKYLAPAAEQVMNLRNALSSRAWPSPKHSYSEEGYRTVIHAQNALFLRTIARFVNLLHERYPDILTQWHDLQAKYAANPNIRTVPVVDRDYIGNHPEFAPYLRELERLGF
jgi:serine/threonine protein kinase